MFLFFTEQPSLPFIETPAISAADLFSLISLCLSVCTLGLLVLTAVFFARSDRKGSRRGLFIGAAAAFIVEAGAWAAFFGVTRSIQLRRNEALFAGRYEEFTALVTRLRTVTLVGAAGVMLLLVCAIVLAVLCVAVCSRHPARKDTAD
jgi:hypothetical protein